MKNQDAGFGIQDSGESGERAPLSPESRILNPELRRLRWRCRRGMLELDIVLGRFVEHCYPGLDEAQKVAFDGLLDEPDTFLWDMITGKKQARDGQQDVLEMLRRV